MEIPFVVFDSLLVLGYHVLQYVERRFSLFQVAAASAFIPVGPASGAKPFAAFPAQRLHGHGQQDVLLDQRVQLNELILVIPVLQILGEQLEFTRLPAILAERSQGILKGQVDGKPEGLETTAAGIARRSRNLSFYKNVSARLLHEELSPGQGVQGHSLKALPVGILFSKGEFQAFIRDTRKGDLHVPIL